LVLFSKYHNQRSFVPVKITNELDRLHLKLYKLTKVYDKVLSGIIQTQKNAEQICAFYKICFIT